MTVDEVLAIGTDALVTMLLVAAPVLGVALVVGLLVSLFQALTQMQEQTLSFVPKIGALALSLLVFGPFMIATLVDFGTRMFEHIADIG